MSASLPASTTIYYQQKVFLDEKTSIVRAMRHVGEDPDIFDRQRVVGGFYFRGYLMKAELTVHGHWQYLCTIRRRDS